VQVPVLKAARESSIDRLAAASFRDPGGRVFRSNGRILRVVETRAAEDLEAFLSTHAARTAMESGKLVRSIRIPDEHALELEGAAGIVYEHERIPFPSYPHEWPAEMLAAAGELTLHLYRNALNEGFGLKDATPYNVLFRGPEPVFVDVLSFERRDPRDAVWPAYGQFTRTFLLPLIAARHFGIEPRIVFGTHRDGLEPEQVYAWAGFWKRVTPSLLNLVSIPKWMGSRANAATYSPKLCASAEQGRFILGHLLRSCGKQLRRVTPPARRDSIWSGYLDSKSLYAPAQLAVKEAFVREALEIARPRWVLDVGANEGRFSFAAAEAGARVIAIDSDAAVVGTIWREAGRRKADVLPLVVDLTRPTPAMGWRNGECSSFLDRARGHFDLVMMLAVVHHMMVSERVPLEEILDLAEELTTNYILIEFVEPADPMFRKIARGRDALFSDLTAARFEAAAARRFEIVKARKIEGLHRWLYLFRRRGARG
jgi:SAM-dependent methyltransferase